jgi:4-diphosphocytidyl-2-C-methyl-D-erythritol kinase
MVNARSIKPAPAKINLHLAVGARRDDGYHPIASIFQAVSLHDTVTVELLDSTGIELVCDCDCATEDNTAYKAAQLFLSAAGDGLLWPVPGLKITINKRIPSGAGLGGGSSDAAATLRALSEMLPGFVSDGQLASIAAGIGSDVPFFLETACARVSGRGERLSPLVPRTDYALVLVNPGFSISTGIAYGTLDAFRESGMLGPAHSIAELSSELDRVTDQYAVEPLKNWSFRNDFYPAMERQYPRLSFCRDALLAAGAMFVSMSGSGSCMYGAFKDADAANMAIKALSVDFDPIMAFPLARLSDSI